MSSENMAAEYKAIQAKLAAAEAALAALRAQKAGRVTLKVSEKGAISVYGFGRFPVTLYWETWQKILAPEFGSSMAKFAADNAQIIAERAAASKAAKQASVAAK